MYQCNPSEVFTEFRTATRVRHIMSCHFRDTDLRALYNDAVLVDERVTARFPPQKLRCSHYLDRTVGF